MRYNTLPTLETERLILRPITMEDVADVYHYAKDPAVSKLLEWEPSASLEETQKIVAQWLENYKENKQAPWGIVDKETGKVIGTIEIRLHKTGKRRAYLGYCLSKDYWGQGLMRQAINRVVNYVFSETNLIEIVAFVRTDNKQSQRMLEKCGFMCEKLQAKQTVMKGNLVNLDRWTLYKK